MAQVYIFTLVLCTIIIIISSLTLPQLGNMQCVALCTCSYNNIYVALLHYAMKIVNKIIY